MSLPEANSDDEAFEARVAEFETAWRSGRIPNIRAFLDVAVLETARGASLMHELIRVDLEYRWKSDAAETDSGLPRRGLRRTLDDYEASLPELGSPSRLPLDLIVEEYRVRRLWGDRPDAAEFMRRFSGIASEVAAALQQVDRELEAEFESPPSAGDERAPAADLRQVPQFDYRDFVLEAYLGGGGSGKVYRAWWKRRKIYVAVKMLRKSWQHQPGAGESFFREAAILAELRHANIVRVHGVGRTPPGGFFLVIDLIDGGDLVPSVDDLPPVAQAVDWVAQAAAGLAFAHAQGVVHRDVKPSNLLLDRFGKVLVADFGLALAPWAGQSTEDRLIGTAAFMAPEQLFGGVQPVGPAADIFGLGAVLYSLLTVRAPFGGRSLIELIERRLAAPLPLSIRAFRSDLPESLEGILAGCMALDPKLRFTTADELATALRRRQDRASA